MIVCIIDDHLLLGQSLKELLLNDQHIDKVYLYGNAEEFLAEKFSDWKPHVVIADIMLPSMNALEMMSRSQALLPTTKFIILTSLLDSGMVKEAFRLGVSGYVTKDASKDELFQAIKVVMAKERYISHSMKDKLLNNLLSEDQVDYNLSLREKEVLEKICAGNTPKEIAHQMGLSIYTVQQFIKRIMRKLKVNRTVDLVVLAIKKELYHPS